VKITLIGPRSVGKSTVSKILADKLNLPLLSSDDLMDMALKETGGLDKTIKAGNSQAIVEKAIPLMRRLIREKDFVLDIAGGSISSTKYLEVSKEVKDLLRNNTMVIGLLPYEDEERSIIHLFDREKHRAHFSSEDPDELLANVRKSYKKLLKPMEEICNFIIITKDNSPDQVANEILTRIESADIKTLHK